MPASVLRGITFALGLTLVGLFVVLVGSPGAQARSYSDVPRSHWAYTAINKMTNKGPAGEHLLDDYGSAFKPAAPVLKAHLARALVVALGQGKADFEPVEIADVDPEHPYWASIQRALKFKLMTLDKAGNFFPDKQVTAATAETFIIRWLKQRNPSFTWSLLSRLSAANWNATSSGPLAAPSYLPTIVASRQLQLRTNHAAGHDSREIVPNKPMSRAEMASMFKRGFDVNSQWYPYGLADFSTISFGDLSPRQKEIAEFALKYIGYPYVWGGEYPTPNSPYGKQGSGGFDCSGFAFYVMKMHFKYPISVNERGGREMAAAGKRISRKNLKSGDIIFFAYGGAKAPLSSIMHVGIYLGNGWFIHSTGSSAGVTLATLNGTRNTYWKDTFWGGRRVLGAGELVVAEAAQ